MERRRHRCLRRVQGLRDLPVAQAANLAQVDDCTLSGREHRDCRADLASLTCRLGDVVSGGSGVGCLDGSRAHIDEPDPLATEGVDPHVARDGSKPGFRRARVTGDRSGLVSAQERGGRDLLGVLGSRAEAANEPLERTPLLSDEPIEAIALAWLGVGAHLQMTLYRQEAVRTTV